MRRTVLAVAALSIAACAPRQVKQAAVVPAAQTAVGPAANQQGMSCASASAPRYFVDGVASTCEAVNRIPTGRISSVEVIKGQRAIDQYGAAASGGVIFVYTKP